MGSKRKGRNSLLGELPNDLSHDPDDPCSEDDDFKPRKTARSQRSQHATGSKNLPCENKPKKTSETAYHVKASDPSSSTAAHKTRSKRSSNTQGNKDESVEAVKKKRVKDDSGVVEEGKNTPHKSQKTKPVPLSNFCPICQVPLNILKITAASHTATCSVSEDTQECPQGNLCLNSNMFHYRDFSHKKLAAFRISEEYCEPDVVFTPKKGKLKHTPLKNSSGKKRFSKSPIKSPTSNIAEKEPGTPSRSSPEGTSKQLFSENPCNVDRKDDRKQQITESQNISPCAIKEEMVQIDLHNGHKEGHENADDVPFENSEDLVQPSLWCSDLILSQDAETEEARSHALCTVDKISPLHVKDEPVSPSGITENVTSNANVIIHYNNSNLEENEQHLVGNQVTCSDKCTVVSENSDELRANCSIVIKATGIDKNVAMAHVPVSVTLAVNRTGWEAVKIKGKSSTKVQKIDVSLCQCSHSLSLECCVNNNKVLEESESNSHEEKFFATMEDMGLKIHNSVLEPTEKFEEENLFQTCSQITISPFALETKSKNVPSKRTSTAQELPTASSSGSSKHSSKVVNAFSLLKSSSSRVSDSAGTSTRSTPTPVPMVVSKATRSSWTLVPGEKNYNSVNKKVPTYKRIPDTSFVVDAFNYGIIPGVRAYFLSHFHSDHFMGLKKNFNLPIFCSQITANLVHLQLRVDKQYLHILKIGEPRAVCGVEVEVYDANHCPGAIMFLFRLLDGRVFLHVGDFRAHPNMEELPKLRQVDKLYLDTTYCDPAYDFPYQEDVVEKVVETVRGHLVKNKSCLIVCGTYTIGKEKVFIGIAEALNFKIWCTTEKRRIYKCLEDQELLDRLTTDPLAAQVHVLAMRDINMEALENYLRKVGKKYSHIVGFKPTGWTTSKSMNGRPSDFQRSYQGNVTIYGVPYSEHSSFSELRRFVRYVRPKDITVTVNVSKSAEYKKLFAKWLASDNDNNGQSKVLQYFTSTKKKDNKILTAELQVPGFCR